MIPRSPVPTRLHCGGLLCGRGSLSILPFCHLNPHRMLASGVRTFCSLVPAGHQEGRDGRQPGSVQLFARHIDNDGESTREKTKVGGERIPGKGFPLRMQRGSFYWRSFRSSGR
nr:hypothetical protein CFP56_09664 [Quercus suber]